MSNNMSNSMRKGNSLMEHRVRLMLYEESWKEGMVRRTLKRGKNKNLSSLAEEQKRFS